MYDILLFLFFMYDTFVADNYYFIMQMMVV